MHTLQTGWCYYAGMDAAKRSNVWVASQSPAAVALLAAAGALPSPTPAQDRARRLGPVPGQEALMQVRSCHLLLPTSDL